MTHTPTFPITLIPTELNRIMLEDFSPIIGQFDDDDLTLHNLWRKIYAALHEADALFTIERNAE